ncbi:MAG: hypothetical protein IPF83_04585 [Rhodanobacteraceae bacterium]|nr:hypothetical protein [Rhodanobacteraceae bacterium]MBP9154381.1 hypothetical protein [Xanthomonadales bacterium]HQW80727.1 hypothetical protein [Pseudomonadota bacterium]
MSVISAVCRLGFVALIAALPVVAQEAGDAPALISETQYTAVFTQTPGSWLLHPAAAGALMRLNVHCRDDAAIAPGLWLVTTDAVGQVELVAPSVTVLPPRHPQRIPLLACDSAESGGLHLPAALIRTLVREHGVVRVDG